MRWGSFKVGDVATNARSYLVLDVGPMHMVDCIVVIKVVDLETTEIMMQAKDARDDLGEGWVVLRGAEEVP